MVGCGGFGPANTGAAIMVRAAASEPAILALTVTFLEFIGIFLYRPYWTRDHAEQNTAPPSACRTIQRAEGSDTDATCLALFKLPPTRSRSREQDAPSTIARNFPTLLRLHRIGRVPIVTRRRLDVLQAPLEHDARGLIRSPCVQNLLEEVCRACEIAAAIGCKAMLIERHPVQRRSSGFGDVEQFVDSDPTCPSIHHQPVQFAHLDALAGKTARFLPDDDFGAVFLIGPFQPACDIHGVADHRVVEPHF